MDKDQDRHEKTARELLALVGGAANVTSVANCITRLRLGLRDRSLADDARIRALPGVMGVVVDDTYQVIVGPAAIARVAEAFQRLLAADPAGPAAGDGAGGGGAGGAGGPVDAAALAASGARIKADLKRKNATPVKLMLRRIANIFVPLIPALIASGIIGGVKGLLQNAEWLPGVVPALTAVSTGFISLIAVFVGVNAAKEFGGTPILGGAVATIVVYPGVADIQVFGEKLSPGQGGVLGALVAAVLCAYLERWARKVVPASLDVLLTPTIAVLLSGLATLYLLMFVAGKVSTEIGDFTNWLLGTGGAVAGFILAGLFLPLVMLGLHQALIPIHTTLIEQNGWTVLLPILAMAGAGQVGAAFAVYRKLPNNKSIRDTIKSALPAGVLGVGEPLIYGVSLPLGRPFITACLGGAFGGAFVGLFNQLGVSAGSTAIGPSGWALFFLTDGNHGIGPAVAVYAGGLLVGYITGFLITYFFGFSKQMLVELNATESPGEQPAETAEPAEEEGSTPPVAAADPQPTGAA